MRKRMVVIGAAFAAMLVAAGAVWFAIAAMSGESAQTSLAPIRAVTFSATAGPLKRVDTDELRRIAGAIQNMGGSMLRTDLSQVRAAVRQVEWVRDAEVRRRFPSTLEVRIEEHTPFARWQVASDTAQSLLVNTQGEVFEAGFEGELPVFSGPKDSAPDVLSNYIAFRNQLVAIQQTPAEVRLSPRRAWQLKLDNGGTLELGRNEVTARLARYVLAFPRIAALQAANARIDLRYQTGFALRQATVSAAPVASRAPAAKPRGKSRPNRSNSTQ